MRLFFSCTVLPLNCNVQGRDFSWRISRCWSLCLCYPFGRGFLSMEETVIRSILVLRFLSICVYIIKESTNSESILSVNFHCCYLYRVLVSMTVSKSQNSIPVSVVPQGGENPLQFLNFFFQLMHIVDRWLKYTIGMAMTSQLLLPSLNCKTYDCSIKISCKFFSYGEFSFLTAL